MTDNLADNDLALARRQADMVITDRETVDLRVSASGDLQTVAGRNNLVQAIINRLLTRQGELRQLGHPTYGSRLYTLIGERNNPRTRGLAELYIRECLAQEQRIQQITRITFAPPSRGADRDTLAITIGVKPVGAEAEFTITLPIPMEG